MWMTFLIYGLLAAAALWFGANPRLPRAARFVLVVAVVALAVVVIYVIGDKTFLGDEPWYRRSPYEEALLFLLMVLGMVARYLTSAIEERRRKLAARKTKPRRKPGIDFDIWEFSYPLLVSVITFGLLLQQIGEEGLALTNSILSFQTGFFWQTLLARSQPAAADG